MGSLFTQAVLDFFYHGKLLKEVSNTIISSVPKIPNPTSLHDYKPISCCNVAYKCITKILAKRLLSVLPSLISGEQSAFVPGRCIADNILLAYELVHGYHSRKGLPRYVLKVDLLKAFDSVEWHFLHVVLRDFHFPPWIADRIMSCVSSVRFSVAVNGEMVGFFPTILGLRLGDTLSSAFYIGYGDPLRTSPRQNYKPWV